MINTRSEQPGIKSQYDIYSGINAVGNIEACRIREGYKTALGRIHDEGSTWAYMVHEGYRTVLDYRTALGYRIWGCTAADYKTVAESTQKDSIDVYHFRLRILRFHPTL